MSLMKIRITKTGVLHSMFILAALFFISGARASADEAAVWKGYAESLREEAAGNREIVTGVAASLANRGEGSEFAKTLALESGIFLDRGDSMIASGDKAAEEGDYRKAYRRYHTANLYYKKAAAAGLNAKSVLGSL